MSSLRIDARSTDGDGGLAAVLASASWVSGRPGSSGPRSEVRSPMVLRREVDGRWRVAREMLNLANPRQPPDRRGIPAYWGSRALRHQAAAEAITSATLRSVSPASSGLMF